MKLLSWNVNGIRAAQKKGFCDWLHSTSADIIAIQETKAHPSQLSDELIHPLKYFSYWSSAERKGYSGVALYTRTEPRNIWYTLGSKKYDTEGRTIIAEYDSFYLMNHYFPNGKKDEIRLAYKLEFYNIFLKKMKTLAKKKGVIVCGDVNTAHREIDLARPKENEAISGFLPEERAWIDRFVESGLIDTFRTFHNEGGHYTWWDVKSRARERNVGWRIDYFFITKNLEASLKNAFIYNQVEGSDHCPIGIEIQV